MNHLTGIINFSEFHQKVQKILKVELPTGASIVKLGRSIAKDVRMGRTAFVEKMGVNSEMDYKIQCARNRQIMFHAHIGMSSWDATAEALTFLYNSTEYADVVVDRVGICLDRRMGLPEEYRETIPAETGPMLKTDTEWMQVGRRVPIQPHMGDFMIGFPASTENTVNALEAGITTIGNLSQFFSHEVPKWRDQVTTTVETVKAIGPTVFEEMFGAGRIDEAYAAGRKPLISTDVFELSSRCINRYRPMFIKSESRNMLQGRRILIASTDVHEHAVMIINQLLLEAGNAFVSENQRKDILELFSYLGEYVILEEEHINTVMALSSPAMVYMFFQSLIDAGVRAGIHRSMSTKIAYQTIVGSMEVWKKRQVPAYELISEAGTPGGISVESLFTLEKYAFKAAIMEAIDSAINRAAVLGRSVE